MAVSVKTDQGSLNSAYPEEVVNATPNPPRVDVDFIYIMIMQWACTYDNILFIVTDVT